jgi:hypothetical protein
MRRIARFRQKHASPQPPSRAEAMVIAGLCLISWVYHHLHPELATFNGHPVQLAWIFAVVMLVLSYLVSSSMVKPPQPPQPELADVPKFQDGATLSRIYGTVWPTPVQLEVMQIQPSDPIKSKSGGKK